MTMLDSIRVGGGCSRLDTSIVLFHSHFHSLARGFLRQGIVAAVDLGLGSEVEPALAYYQKTLAYGMVRFQRMLLVYDMRA